FAYQDSGNYSETELRDLAQQSIWRMEEQIQHVREAFGLEAPVRKATSTTPQPVSPELATVVRPDQSLVTPATLPESTSPPANVLSNLHLTTDEEMLDEFGDVV
ncbi:MAG: hypothetical protein F6K19_23195, partial [Cyanothece sp. SIO1E1]|nr:hypothetical protein [Cyanothece sp. SIO1E1]